MSKTGNSDLERVTVNFIPRSSRALRLSVQLTRDSRTDIINRHVQLGSWIEWQISRGAQFFVQEPGAPGPARILFSPGLGLPHPDEVDRALGAVPDPDATGTVPDPDATGTR